MALDPRVATRNPVAHGRSRHPWLGALAGATLALGLVGDTRGAMPPPVEWISQGRSSELPRRILEVLETPDEVTLLELIPEVAAREPEGRFHDQSIAARGELAGAMARNALSVALTQSFRRLQPDRFCFLPRHGFRLRRGEEVVDLVASFECERVAIHTSWGEEGALGIDEAAQTQFDALFGRAGARSRPRPPLPPYAPGPEQ